MKSSPTSQKKTSPLLKNFAHVKDPRMEGKKLHPLSSIIATAILAVLCGADTWNEIEDFGHIRKKWLSTFLDLPHGIPSHDTFNRVFAALDPDAFALGFTKWTASIGKAIGGVIAIDGKTVRRSHGGIGENAIHMVSAWSQANHLILGQEKVNAKSNEITAIPELLDQLYLVGAIVTIDAMGCQRDIAQKIVKKGGNYVLAVKENQKSLYEDIVDTYSQAILTGYADIIHDTNTTRGTGHGRIEVRYHTVVTDPDVLQWIQKKHQWPGLQAIGMVESHRTVGDNTSQERRYYILSSPLDAKEFGFSVRSHWGIENSVHWVLDMAFREDESRKRLGNAAENFSTIRRLVINLIRQHPRKGMGIRSRRFIAGLDPEGYMLELLQSV